MCSLGESDEAYQFLGLPGYNPHLSKETFQKYYDLAKDRAKEKAEKGVLIPDRHKMLLINATRVFNIAANGRNWLEREDLARTYFDMVSAVDVGMLNPENYYPGSSIESQLSVIHDRLDRAIRDYDKTISQDPITQGDENGHNAGGNKATEGRDESRLLLQIYLVNEERGIYGFRPILRYGYLYHRLLRADYLIGSYPELKKRIDWTYLPQNLHKESIEYLCSPSYFRKGRRERLARDTAESPKIYYRDLNWYFWPGLQ